MDRPTSGPLCIGAWRVDPASGQISRAGEVVRLEARTMRLLVFLAERAGETVSIEELLDHVWAGVIVTPDSVYQAVASLRRLLGDDARQPAYIVTVPRLGYRMMAPVSPWIEESLTPAALAPAAAEAQTAGVPSVAKPRWRAGGGPMAAAAAAVCLAIAGVVLLGDKLPGNHRAVASAAGPTTSVAVLPFLDLTSERMDEEYFADGMTEELIDRLSAIPGIRVPAPAASFYFKGKKLPVADIARSLGVVYVLSGSVRESDSMLRIAVRLTRADDGYVLWSQTYDRPTGDKLKVQEDIAAQVTKALGTWIRQGA